MSTPDLRKLRRIPPARSLSGRPLPLGEAGLVSLVVGPVSLYSVLLLVVVGHGLSERCEPLEGQGRRLSEVLRELDPGEVRLATTTNKLIIQFTE